MTMGSRRVRGLGAPAGVFAVLAGLALLASGSCDGGALAPATPGDSTAMPPRLEAGRLSAAISADNPGAQPGDIVTLTVRIRGGEGAPTPTGFDISLLYDPHTLTPVKDVSPSGDNTLRAVNLGAGSGLVEAGGAAPTGLSTDTLFAVSMKVTSAGWSHGLSLKVRELDVLQENFADVAAEVITPLGLR